MPDVLALWDLLAGQLVVIEQFQDHPSYQRPLEDATYRGQEHDWDSRLTFIYTQWDF